MSRHVVVVGAGIFGVSGALALATRGQRVTLIDAGAIPHPLAESTDVSKAVRMDYGRDELYTAEMERAIEGWRAWNDAFGETLFHETGAMFVTRVPMTPGGFEHDSFTTLSARGHALTRLDQRAIEAQSSLRGFVDGYFNAEGGWAASARVVERLAGAARDRGVIVREHARAERIVIDASRARRVVLDDGQAIDADAVVIAAGGWSTALVPEIAPFFRMTAQPVFHVACDGDVRLPMFGADIARTGWYGFPFMDGFVKVANHGPGRAMPSSTIDRSVTREEESRARAFLAEALPMIASAPIVSSRVCVYTDTRDEHFFIAPHADVPNLVVASGGSGHAFKFAPRIGDWIANALDGEILERFRWRTEDAPGAEAARHRGESP